MSELKEVEYPNCFGSYYRKDEADKYILKLKADLVRWENYAHLGHGEILRELRHHKYKRCLAMWLYLRECYWRCKHHNEKTRADWYEKWMDNFQKLAEKFKEYV